MKKTISFIAILSLIFGVYAFSNSAKAENTYVTLEINPSVELIVTPSDKVIYANLLNDDGETLLVELDLVGMKLDDATNAIIETAIELDFIDATNSETVVTVSALSKDIKMGEIMRNRVKENVNGALNRNNVRGRAEDKPENGYIPDFFN